MAVDERVPEMVSLYVNEGLTLDEIGRRYKLTHQRIHQLIGKHYDRPHHGRIRREQRDAEVRAAHARVISGETTLAAEAKRLQILPTSLRDAFTRLGLPPLRPPSPKHGTHYRYSRGCRCDLCKTADKAYRQSFKDREPPQHGTENSYAKYGCRCAACLTAGKRRYRRLKARKRLSATPVD